MIADCDDCGDHFRDWMVLAVIGLAGALTGVVVDAAAVAMYELQPSSFFVEFGEPGVRGAGGRTRLSK